MYKGRPGGVVVFLHSVSVAQGSQVWTLGADLHAGHAVAASHVQNRGRLAQMSAQDQSSSPKKKKCVYMYIYAHTQYAGRDTKRRYNLICSLLS